MTSIVETATEIQPFQLEIPGEQTHVRIYRDKGAIEIELWEHPRASRQSLRGVGRLAVAGRLPAEPSGQDASPRVLARASID